MKDSQGYTFGRKLALAGAGIGTLCVGLMAGEPTALAQDESVAEAPTPEVKVSGAVRFTYLVKSWDGETANRKRAGDIIFDTLQLGADGSYGPLSVSGAYRFYQGYHMLHHGYLGYALSDTAQIDVGLTQVPFGVLPFASHNWFFNLPYYLGLEDDYDLGVRGTFQIGDIDLRVGFYKNSEGTYTGNSLDSARYSYDVVQAPMDELAYAGATSDHTNTETNQLNVRAAYNLEHGDLGKTELGVSGRVGGLHNAAKNAYGYHWAAGAHANGTYGPLNVHLQGIAYRFEPNNPAEERDDVIVMGAYDAPYYVAAAGYLLSANVDYTLPFKTDLISSVSIHENYSVLLKDDDDFRTTHQNALGALVVIGPIYTYIDLVSGRNHPWLGPGGGYGGGLAEGRFNEDGSPDGTWHTRFNVNVGYYF